MLIKVETLNRIFRGRPDAGLTVYEAVCSDCSMRVRISVSRTATGYGFQGGVLYEPKPAEILAKCPACYKARPNWTGARNRASVVDIDGGCNWNVIEGEGRKTRLRRSGSAPGRARSEDLPNLSNAESTDH
jgi:hypothetical protein